MTLKGSGFVLDGFPRNISQAEALEEMLKQDGQTIDRAIFLTVPQDVLLKRLAGRRVCQRCGAAFHVENKPPRVAEQCDVCGDKLVLRSDDQEHVVVERLKAYEQNTRPLREYYEKRQLLLTVDGMGSELDVYQRLISGLQKRL
jgi:adenylate kinase